jgi:hypothetical protein
MMVGFGTLCAEETRHPLRPASAQEFARSLTEALRANTSIGIIDVGGQPCYVESPYVLEDIVELRRVAAERGDAELASTCVAALASDSRARLLCEMELLALRVHVDKAT